VKRIGSMIGVAAMAYGVAAAQSGPVTLTVSGSGDASKHYAEGLAITAAKFGVFGTAVKGAPYAADGITETTQTLGDGTHINRQETYSIYRDAEGRIRRESGDQVWISDPVAKVSYVLDTKQQTARKLALSRNMTVNYGKTPTGPQTMLVQNGAIGGGGMAIVLDRPVADDGDKATAEAARSEPLGKQKMEGVDVDGMRTTTVIPQGQIGNDRPLQMVHERWESAELHVTIFSKHTDPMMGERVERLTNVRRGEPDPALFQVPAGYAIESEK
jgi:hypothetical protein